MKKMLLTSAALALVACVVGRLCGGRQGHAGQGAGHGAAAEILRQLPCSTRRITARSRRRRSCRTPKERAVPRPPPENSVAGQIDIVTNATTQGVAAIMISNNIGDQIVPAAKAAHDKGIKIVTWDSPIPSAEAEDVFVAQVDFTETGKVMADMALKILPDGGKFAILSASPDAANQNAWIKAFHDLLKSDPKYAKLEEVDLVYGNDESEKSYNQALALVDKHPDLQLIMAPTSIGIVAAAKAMQDEKLCDKVKVSGLGLPSEMLAYTMNGCAPEFALWSFVDLGYLDLLHRLHARHRRPEGRGRRQVHGRPDGRLHDHQGRDPRQGPAHPDGRRSRSTTRTTSRRPPSNRGSC